MATISTTFFDRSLSFFLVLFHLSCFTITPAAVVATADASRLERKLSSLLSKSSLKSQKAISSSWFFLIKLFKSFKALTHPLSSSPRSSIRFKSSPPQKLSDFNADNILPCTSCDEIFHKPQTLKNHQGIKHAVSELHNNDTGKNIVEIIFRSGWNVNEVMKVPMIHRVMKIHNSAKTLARFEEYREFVKAKATKNRGVKDARCMADGNELLMFHCTTFLCELGIEGSSEICSQQYCSFCGIIKGGLSSKLGGISTHSRSSRAHVASTEEIEKEFKFMNVKRAMLVCRVLAGRVGCDSHIDDDDVDKDACGFDSVASGTQIRVDEEELLVFNLRAVLPCFVIVYTV